jgi:hypothetical protein
MGAYQGNPHHDDHQRAQAPDGARSPAPPHRDRRACRNGGVDVDDLVPADLDDGPSVVSAGVLVRTRVRPGPRRARPGRPGMARAAVERDALRQIALRRAGGLSAPAGRPGPLGQGHRPVRGRPVLIWSPATWVMEPPEALAFIQTFGRGAAGSATGGRNPAGAADGTGADGADASGASLPAKLAPHRAATAAAAPATPTPTTQRSVAERTQVGKHQGHGQAQHEAERRQRRRRS